MATIGIDLGTTNSVVCVMDGDQPKVITNEDGGRTTPSVVAFEDNGNVLVGQQARRQAITNPTNTVFSVKRFVGLRMDEAKDEAERMPYEVKEGKGGGVSIAVGGKDFAPPEIAARILSKLKQAAEDYLGTTVTDAVITVPAYFNDAQRQATKDAGKIAGLNVKRIVNEPTAAALAYAQGKNAGEEERLVAVYDLGGGTFDISILEVADDVVEVVSTAGDTHLGGDDFDDKVIDWLLAEFKKDSGMDISGDKLVLQRLKDAAEKAKIELSQQSETEINLPFLTADASGPKHLQTKLTRAKFESLIEELVERSLGPVKQALEDAGKEAKDIDDVLLVGGSTRVPLVQAKVQALFGKEPSKAVNPDEVVGMGAAVQAGVLDGNVKDIVLVDVTPLSLGIETLGGVTTVLIPRNTTIPTRRSEVFTTASDNQPSVDVHVLQGERKMSADNRTLARFGLTGLPPAPRGTPQIEVVFDIDANGIVNVSAIDKATGKEQTVKITASGGLSDTEVNQMVDEAKKFEEEDAKRREEVDARNELEALVYSTEKTLTEFGDKVSAEAKTEAETALAEAKASIEAREHERIVAAKEGLTKAAHALASAMYGAGGSGPTAPTADAANNAPKPDDAEEVIDAEFEEKAS